MRTAKNIICFKDRKVLLVRKKEFWILPGGKPEQGESDATCIFRECFEDLPEAAFSMKERYGAFAGTILHKGDLMTATAYFWEAYRQRQR